MKGRLEEIISYSFKDKALLTRALTHSSCSHETGGESNERLEFLGDAVLEFIVSGMLYESFPEMPEGWLTKRRAALVCESSLAEAARNLAVGEFLLLGKGEDSSGGRGRGTVLSDAIEALIGAIYLDGGIDAATEFIERTIGPAMEGARLTDPKTALQEILQRGGGAPASYEIIGESGPPHRKRYQSSVSHMGRTLGIGSGSNKKESEQNAASAALEKLGIQ